MVGRGACMVAGGVRDCGGACMVGKGACMVSGGACVVAGGHAWLWGGACVGYNEIRSMSGWYASYWNAFLWYDGSILYDLTIQFHYIFSPTNSFHKILKNHH